MRTAQKTLVDKLADNESLQRFVLSTNKRVEENRKKAIKKIQDSEAFRTFSEQSPSNFFTEFSKNYKEEMKKEISDFLPRKDKTKRK